MPRRNPCGKKVYRTRIIAMRVLVHLPVNERRREARAYFCTPCHGWHLTSQL